MYYQIREKLESTDIDQCLSQQGIIPYVIVLSPSEWAKYKDAFDMGFDINPNPEHIYNSKAEVNYDSITGTFSIPDRANLMGDDFVFSFALDEKGIVFIDRSGSAERFMENIAKTKKWREPSLEHFLYEFLERIIINDRERLERYEKELNSIEAEILQGIEDMSTARINQIRGNLLKLRTHYEQILDLGQVFEENENNYFKEENIRLFLNDVAEYQYHYIGRSRWTADGNFGGGIKDLRLYRENLNASPLLARFFSTNSVWYEAVTDDYEGLVSAGNGSAPSYNSTTGYTTLYSNNYLKVSSPGLFAGVTPETGLTLSFSYRPTQDEHYVQLMSFGKNAYGSGTDDHFYIGATFHETYKDSNMRNPLIFEWRYGNSSKVCTWPQGLAFSAGTTYDVEIAISRAEGVVYTVNGIKYTARYYYGTKADISTFLNAVAGYQYGYIGRSRWTGDTQFAGDIKDLRFYKTVMR